eukprot:gene2444-3083_t
MRARVAVVYAAARPWELAGGGVVVNEVAPKGGGGVCDGDWVELANTGAAAADLSGHRLCDDKGCDHGDAFTFPAWA